jgi:hypothetical protein
LTPHKILAINSKSNLPLFFFFKKNLYCFLISSFNIWFTRLHDLLHFLFYVVISFFWPISLVWRVNLINSNFFFFFLISIFFPLYPSILSSLWIMLHDLIWFDFYEVIPTSWFRLWVFQVDLSRLGLFYCVFLDWILLFNFNG